MKSNVITSTILAAGLAAILLAAPACGPGDEHDHEGHGDEHEEHGDEENGHEEEGPSEVVLTEAQVEPIPMASPAIRFVATPVWLCSAMRRTGPMRSDV